MNRFIKTAFFVAPALLLLAFVFEGLGVLVYLPSFAYHGVNLQAFVFRRTDAASFAVRSVGLRSLAFGLLAVLAVWSGDVRLSAAGLSLLAGGLVLHALAVRALGPTRTCYGMELGAVPRAAVTTFPYNAIAHPMHAGSVMQFAGAYFGGSGTPISAEVEHRFRRKWNTDFGMWNADFGMWNIHSGGSGTPVPES